MPSDESGSSQIGQVKTWLDFISIQPVVSRPRKGCGRGKQRQPTIGQEVGHPDSSAFVIARGRVAIH